LEGVLNATSGFKRERDYSGLQESLQMLIKTLKKIEYLVSKFQIQKTNLLREAIHNYFTHNKGKQSEVGFVAGVLLLFTRTHRDLEERNKLTEQGKLVPAKTALEKLFEQNENVPVLEKSLKTHKMLEDFLQIHDMVTKKLSVKQHNVALNVEVLKEMWNELFGLIIVRDLRYDDRDPEGVGILEYFLKRCATNLTTKAQFLKGIKIFADIEARFLQVKMLQYDYFTNHEECGPDLEFLKVVLTLSKSGPFNGNPDLSTLQASLQARINELEEEQRPREPSTPSICPSVASTTATTTVKTVLETMVPTEKENADETSSSATADGTAKAPQVQDCIKVWRKKIRYKTSEWQERWMKRDTTGEDPDRLFFGTGGPDAFVVTESFLLRNAPVPVIDEDDTNLDTETIPDVRDELISDHPDYLHLDIEDKYCGENPLTGWTSYFHKAEDGKFHRQVKPINPESDDDWEMIQKMCTPIGFNDLSQAATGLELPGPRVSVVSMTAG